MNGNQPTPRNGHSANVFKNNMYVFGGRESEEKSLNDLWKLNLQTFEWAEIIYS